MNTKLDTATTAFWVFSFLFVFVVIGMATRSNQVPLEEQYRTAQLAAKNAEIDNQKADQVAKFAAEYEDLLQGSSNDPEDAVRMNYLWRQIQTLDPELVNGYDENNRPIPGLKKTLPEIEADAEKAEKDMRNLQARLRIYAQAAP